MRRRPPTATRYFASRAWHEPHRRLGERAERAGGLARAAAGVGGRRGAALRHARCRGTPSADERDRHRHPAAAALGRLSAVGGVRGAVGRGRSARARPRALDAHAHPRSDGELSRPGPGRPRACSRRRLATRMPRPECGRTIRIASCSCWCSLAVALHAAGSTGVQTQSWQRDAVGRHLPAERRRHRDRAAIHRRALAPQDFARHRGLSSRAKRTATACRSTSRCTSSSIRRATSCRPRSAADAGRSGDRLVEPEAALVCLARARRARARAVAHPPVRALSRSGHAADGAGLARPAEGSGGRRACLCRTRHERQQRHRASRTSCCTRSAPATSTTWRAARRSTRPATPTRDRNRLYPQAEAEIMAGRRALSAQRFEMPREPAPVSWSAPKPRCEIRWTRP